MFRDAPRDLKHKVHSHHHAPELELGVDRLSHLHTLSDPLNQGPVDVLCAEKRVVFNPKQPGDGAFFAHSYFLHCLLDAGHHVDVVSHYKGDWDLGAPRRIQQASPSPDHWVALAVPAGAHQGHPVRVESLVNSVVDGSFSKSLFPPIRGLVLHSRGVHRTRPVHIPLSPPKEPQHLYNILRPLSPRQLVSQFHHLLPLPRLVKLLSPGVGDGVGVGGEGLCAAGPVGPDGAPPAVSGVGEAGGQVAQHQLCPGLERQLIERLGGATARPPPPFPLPRLRPWGRE
mmetsp:Transcript_17253/g.38063  ORF Transcript_17253/g.38063 Transcript_17253/m.38063 type:complete len:285 (-) Transcript_17253:208-1062(-)